MLLNQSSEAMTDFNQLSIVIPVGPDDHSWHQLLKELKIFGEGVEIILSACQQQPVYYVLDGNVQWIKASQGRAKQLNAGAKKATGSLIWFLHADTQLTGGVLETIQQLITSADRSLGYFRLKFSGNGLSLTQLNAWAANIRSRYFDLPFGDQGFIMQKTIFQQLNGFDETLVLGEDLDFVVRARAAGIALNQLPAELLTSSRRYQQQGWLLTTVRHLYLTWLLTRQAKQRLVLN